MEKKEKKMAIMKNVGFGLYDRNEPFLYFTAMNGCIGALQCIFYPDYVDVFKAYSARDVKDLEGKSCWVEKGDGMMVYKEPCII